MMWRRKTACDLLYRSGADSSLRDGTTHHGASILRSCGVCRNMVIKRAEGRERTAAHDQDLWSFDGPASVRYARGVSLRVPMDPEPTALPIGKGELLREGTDVAIVAIGVTVWRL